MNTERAYPLHWPEGWPRTRHPKRSQFKTTLSAALKNVEKALGLFAKDTGKKIENISISSNVTLGNMVPADAGVVVSFTWDGMQAGYPVDLYDKVQDNLQAIYHCIEAERTKHRHGGLHMVRAALSGSLKLPAPGASTEDWWHVLGVDRNASEKIVQTAYRRLRKQYHPDNQETGNPSQFARVQKAYKQYGGAA